MADDENTKPSAKRLSYLAAYRAANRERIKKRSAEWYAANRERVRARERSNREKRNARQRLWWRSLPDEAKTKRHAQIANYRKLHHEEISRANSLRQASAREAGRLSWLAKKAKSRAKTRGLEFDGLRQLIESKPPTHCACCGCELDYSAERQGNGRVPERLPSLDRVDPSRGYTGANTQVICYRCNSLKRDATISELRTILNYMEKHASH